MTTEADVILKLAAALERLAKKTNQLVEDDKNDATDEKKDEKKQ